MAPAIDVTKDALYRLSYISDKRYSNRNDRKFQAPKWTFYGIDPAFAKYSHLVYNRRTPSGEEG